MSAKRVLVTGGTGFIGAALVKGLLETGHEVRVLDNNSRGSMRRLDAVAGDFDLHCGDIRDARSVTAAMNGMDAVCHLAYINGTEFFYQRPDEVLDVAIRGMLNVLDACCSEDVGELVLASSSEVYQTPPAVPTGESVPLSVPDVLNPRYSYGGGKILCELMAVNYGRRYLDRVLIFRPHNVYGPDMGWEHVIPQFARRMAELSGSESDPLPFPIQGNGRQTRAFVYISDFTDGLLRVIGRGEHLGIYHIGTDHEVTIAEVAHEVAACYGRRIDIVPGEEPAGATPRRCPDISKLRELGYEPCVSLGEGVEKTVGWYREHADLRGGSTEKSLQRAPATA